MDTGLSIDRWHPAARWGLVLTFGAMAAIGLIALSGAIIFADIDPQHPR